MLDHHPNPDGRRLDHPVLDPSTPTTWYVSERVAMPYEVATAALGSIVPVSAVEAATDGRFAVDRVLHARPGSVQGFLGRLRCGRLPWQTQPVELMVEPWSTEESVVGLRPTRRPRAHGERYFAGARTVLDALRAELLATTVVATSRAVPVAEVEELPRAS